MAQHKPKGELKRNLRKLQDSAVCIITARAGEAKVLAEALGIDSNVINGHDVWEIDNSFSFYPGSIPLKEGQLDYYITSGRLQGVQSFAIDCGLLLHILTPKFVVHAGVCAGYSGDEKIKLGDVIFAEKAVNYTEGKFMHVDGHGIVFRPDYQTAMVHAGDMQGFVEFGQNPRHHYGSFLTGTAVRSGDAQEIFKQLRDHFDRNAIALDMEASAFLQLCGSFKNTTSLGVVKGVSDFGDGNKRSDNEKGFPTAIINTAEALKSWLAHRVPAITWEPDYSNEPAADLVPGYYHNFVEAVLQNVEAGADVTSIDDPDSPLYTRDQIRGFRCVMPPKSEPRFFLNVEARVHELKTDYNIDYVRIGRKGGKTRDLYYYGGYLIDFVRTINSLTRPSDDGELQARVFATLLSSQPLFESSDPKIEPRALMDTWEEFKMFLITAKEEQANLVRASKPAKKNVSSVSLTPVPFGPPTRGGGELPISSTSLPERKTEPPTPTADNMETGVGAVPTRQTVPRGPGAAKKRSFMSLPRIFRRTSPVSLQGDRKLNRGAEQGKQPRAEN